MSDFEIDSNHHLCKCGKIMKMVCSSDWDNGVFWCQHCGAILTLTMAGTEKWEFLINYV